MFADNDCLAFVGQKAISYKQMGHQVKAVINFLEKQGIKQGDKVAVLSNNMPNWGIAYFAIVSMGCVVVPILPDFSSSEVTNVLEHSETRAIFISPNLKNKITESFDLLDLVINIIDFSLIKSAIKAEYDENNHSETIFDVKEDDLASIIYTSGTTGKSKGVMLSHRNISFTASASRTIQPIGPEDRFLSVLPLSHTYENSIGFILPIICGSSIYYLNKPPTPAILLPALKQVKPTMMLTVPLIIEKIYKNKVLPAFNDKWLTRVLYKTPVIKGRLNRLAGKKLMRTFGGELKFFGIGGAKLSRTVEKFLMDAKFPYAIGYGLTESAPLLAGSAPFSTKLQSTGPNLQGVTLKINDAKKFTGEGEIWAKGPNVMMGYYKEPKLTKEVISEDGWLKTGDLGIVDEEGYLFIRGRSKNVILGPSGENIFPEDIESIINNFKHVAESLVISQKGKLVALVHFNTEEIEQQYKFMKSEVSNFVEKKTEELQKELKDFVNSKVNRFSRIQTVVIQREEFVKTATKKIKRFLYH